MKLAALRALLYVGGTVAGGAGLHTAITGAKSIPGRDAAADPITESELRFYGTFYAAYGAALLRAAERRETSRADVNALASVLFAAGLARLGAWRAVGKPSPQQTVLLALELTVPPLVVALSQRSR